MSSFSIPVSNTRVRQPNTVAVWDLGVRAFHWGLVATVAAALLTGFVAPDWWIDIHIAAGSAVAALIAFRSVLGVIGSPYARFWAFAYRPSRVFAYVKSVFLGRPDHYRGHNPLGALMVFALLAALGLICLTGVVALGGEEKRGPLAFLVPFALGDAANAFHEVLAWLIVGFVGLHIGGVLFASRHERINLVASMVGGQKPDRPHADYQPERRQGSMYIAVTTTLLLIFGGALLTAMSYLPAAGIPHTALDPQYRTQCGDCHIAFHPSLLPAKSWRDLMASLGDHFGEDASLDGKQAAAIGVYLAAHSSERYDTKAANRFRTIDPDAPMRITETPFWRRKHRGITEDVFRSRAVAARSACVACHGDAETGLFADAAIALPVSLPILQPK